MGYFKLTLKGKNRGPYFVKHENGSQHLYEAVEELLPSTLANNGFPLSLELDGWGDDQSCIGDIYEHDSIDIEHITEEEFRDATNQKDTPTALLSDFVK